MEVLAKKSSSSNLLQRLSLIDWNFPYYDCKNGIHSIHPYPAKFIPEIPRTLIRELSIPKGTAVLDPFCGAGATLVESQSCGLKSIGIDLNPIACLISKVKTRSIQSRFLDTGIQVTGKARNHGRIILPQIPNVGHWFPIEVQTALTALLSEIRRIPVVELQDALNLVLSSIIVKVSNQESDTRYAAVSKNFSEHDVYDAFETGIQRLFKIKKECPSATVESTILNGNTLNVTPSDISLPIGLVITSPPYPNAYEYWLYHKYRMWWLGYNPLEVKECEIGARAHFFEKKHHTAHDFHLQMGKTLALLKQVVVRRGYICIVIGRSIIHGQIIDNAGIIEELCKGLKIKAVAKLERNIASYRKSFNLSHANIKTENILIFQN